MHQSPFLSVFILLLQARQAVLRSSCMKTFPSSSYCCRCSLCFSQVKNLFLGQEWPALFAAFPVSAHLLFSGALILHVLPPCINISIPYCRFLLKCIVGLTLSNWELLAILCSTTMLSHLLPTLVYSGSIFDPHPMTPGTGESKGARSKMTAEAVTCPLLK